MDYDGQVQYFAKRSLTGLIRLLIGTAIAVIGAVIIIAQFSTTAVHPVPVRAVSIAFAVTLLISAVAWWVGRWPSRRVSRAGIIYLDIGILVASLLNIQGLAGVFGLSGLILVSFYIVFFDGPKIIVLHTIWVIASMVVIAVKIAAEVNGDPPLIAARALAGAVLAFAPAATQFGIWVLRNDANVAATDPLTGLLNRRGLYILIDDMLRRRSEADRHVVVAVIDLDRFKRINDAFGHAVGDQVLVRSAERLQGVVGDGALVARVGGEEFVVVDVIESTEVRRVAEGLRTAFTGPGDQTRVTASVGVTTMPVAKFGAAGDPAQLLDELIGQADEAMFAAKREGGDKVVHLPVP